MAVVVNWQGRGEGVNWWKWGRGKRGGGVNLGGGDKRGVGEGGCKRGVGEGGGLGGKRGVAKRGRVVGLMEGGGGV